MNKSKRGSGVILGVIGIYLMIPLLFTFIYSMFSEWMDVMPTGFTLRAYAEIFSDGAFWMSIGRTIVISILPIILCTLAVLLAMYVVVVYCPWLDKYMKILCTMPYAIQGVILPISVLALYADAPEPFSNRIFMLTYLLHRCSSLCIPGNQEQPERDERLPPDRGGPDAGGRQVLCIFPHCGAQYHKRRHGVGHAGDGDCVR